jgi:REP element-mobilizing transposase RayT
MGLIPRSSASIFFYLCYVSDYIHKSHNVSVLLYHFVCPTKYRRVFFTESLDRSLKEICLCISERYEIYFIEIGTDKDHVHFLIQSVPMYSPSKTIQIIKSITAKELFRLHPEVKRQLWGGEFWTKGYYVNTVGRHGDESTIQAYVKSQGREKEYQIVHSQQLALF